MFSSGRKLLVFAILFLLGGVSTTRAQGRVELTPFGGSRFGGVIDFSQPSFGSASELTIKSSVDYGVMGDFSLFPNLQAEFMWNRQPTQLSEVSAGTKTLLGDATLDMYQWSLLYQFRDPREKLKPFLVGGVGFTHFDSNGVLPFENRFSYNIGGGVKYYFNRHLGLRLDVRYSPSRTTSSLATFCDLFGCFTARVPNYAQQGQANLGVILRF